MTVAATSITPHLGHSLAPGTEYSVLSTPSSKPAVTCRGITKEFGAGDARVMALRGVDLEVRPGEMTLLVGPSGCGKTTLISIIAGLLDPTAGEVAVLGQELHRL